MEKEFIPYELALKLKALGFKERCLTYYGENKPMLSDVLTIEGWDYNTSFLNWTSRPTFQQAFRWFREKYGLFVSPNVISYEDGLYLWFFEINSTVLPFGTDLGETDDYKTYEEAELACLEKLIELVETKTN
jgi:hypothetical protein